jgi:hypothetical protein
MGKIEVTFTITVKAEEGLSEGDTVAAAVVEAYRAAGQSCVAEARIRNGATYTAFVQDGKVDAVGKHAEQPEGFGPNGWPRPGSVHQF